MVLCLVVLQSDVWSLGVLLYQCCTLKLPFEANNPYVLMCKIIKGAPRLPTTAYHDHST